MIEEIEEYSDDSLFNITSWGADMTFRELANMYSDGELVRPEFQRNYVWSKLEASRFVESILLGLPVPSIFLANSKKNEKLIIDGFQRIMTVFDYMVKKKFGSEDILFKLTNSTKINERWRNKAFEELTTEDQRKLRSSTIHAIIFEQKHPKDDDTSMFQIFARINTSGRSLNAQEIRNCVCQGAFNTLLIKLNENPIWRQLYGTSSPDQRMLDLELILRFFAIRDLKDIEESRKQINLRKYLDIYMQQCSDSTLDEKRHDFEQMIDLVFSKLGVTAFKFSLDGMNRGKINAPLFDAISVAADEYIHIRDDGGNVGDLTHAKVNLLQNAEFIDAAKYRTTNIVNIEKRIAIAKRVLFNLN